MRKDVPRAPQPVPISLRIRATRDVSFLRRAINAGETIKCLQPDVGLKLLNILPYLNITHSKRRI